MIAGREYVGGSGIVYSAADVLGMSVVHVMKGFSGLSEMCMCLARGGVAGEWIRGLDVCFCCGCVGRGLGPCS